MECRAGCGACCISPSITQPYFGMPEGKKAGQRCVHLSSDKLCDLFNDSRRPKCCSVFQAEEWVCGETYEQALLILAELEISTMSQKNQ